MGGGGGGCEAKSVVGTDAASRFLALEHCPFLMLYTVCLFLSDFFVLQSVSDL